MSLHCHNERNVFSMWIHSEFDDKKDQVWSKHVLPSVLIKYRAVMGKFCLNSWTFDTNQVSSLCDPAEVIMWIQLISINKLLSWVMTCLQCSRLSVWARGEHCVPKKTLCLLKHSRFYWSAQDIYVMFVEAEKHLQHGRQGSRTEKKKKLDQSSMILFYKVLILR